MHSYKARDFDIKRQLVAQMIPQPAAFFRRSVWQQIGPLRTDLTYTMDRDFWNRAALSFPIIHVPLLIADMRMHASSKTVSQAREFALETGKLYDDIFAETDLPSELRQLESEARGVNYFELGYKYYRSGDLQQARGAFAHAWHWYPPNPKKLMIIPFWVDCVLGTSIAPHLHRLAHWLRHGVPPRD